MYDPNDPASTKLLERDLDNLEDYYVTQIQRVITDMETLIESKVRFESNITVGFYKSWLENILALREQNER